MLDDILYRLKLRKLRWKQFWIDSRATREEKKARQNGATADELREIRESFAPDYFDTVDEIEKLRTHFILMKADIEVIPVPEKTNVECWREATFGNSKVLTEKGFNDLRKAIRAEIKDRQTLVLPIATFVLSLMAALAGIWNIFLKK